MTLPSEDFTRFVERLNAGDREAREELAPHVMDELHRIAARFVREGAEVSGIEHDMLVDDAFMRLTRPEFRWRNAREFYGAAAKFMRNRLVDGYKARRRGSEFSSPDIDLDRIPAESSAFELLELTDVIESIREEKPLLAEVIDVHLLLGLSIERTATAMGLRPSTVSGRWRRAKQMLRERLELEPTTKGAVAADTGVAVELSINEDFDSFAGESQERFLSKIEEILGAPIRLIGVRRGSTKLTIELTREQAEQLLWLYERGVLKDMDVSNARVLGDAAAAAIIKAKAQADDYDVFLCHNSKDKQEVKRIGLRLRQRGVLPWLDEWELRPGLPWQQALEKNINTIKSAAVFVGDSGIGPWQDMEVSAFIREFVKRQCPVIPVVLRGCSAVPSLPTFLNGMMWVDFRKRSPSPYDQLVWGITGRKP